MAGVSPDSMGASRTLDSSGLSSPYRSQTAQLRAMIATKEKELHDATEFRLQALEDMLTERVRGGSDCGSWRCARQPAVAPGHGGARSMRTLPQDSELADLKEKFKRMRDDFAFNLQVRGCAGKSMRILSSPNRPCDIALPLALHARS